MVEKMLRRGFMNGRHAPTEAVVCVVPTHARGQAKTLLEDEMVPRNEAGVEQYGATGTYHITDIDAAVEFIRDNGGDVPFGFD